MFGTGEMLIIALVAIIVVDPKKLPDLMKSLGKALGEFKQMSGEFKRTIERETEAADFEKRKAEAEQKLFGDKKEGAAPGGPDAARDKAASNETTPGGPDAAPAASPAGEPESIAEDAQERGDAAAKSTVESDAAAPADSESPTETPASSEPAATEPTVTPEPVEPAESAESQIPQTSSTAEEPAPVPSAEAAQEAAAAPEPASAAPEAPAESKPASEAAAETASAAADTGAEASIPAGTSQAPASAEEPAVPEGGAPDVPANSTDSAAPGADETPSTPANADEPQAPAAVETPAAPAVSEPAPAPAEAGGAGLPPSPPPPPTGDDAVGEGQSGRMSLFGHLQDLRKRLTRSAIAMVVGFLVCYAYAGQMLKILMQPMLNALKQSHFIYTVPTEAFFTEMKVAFVAGIFVASPYIFYQIYQFVAPGLYSHERRWIAPIAFFSALFFTAGAVFGYFVVFPFGFEFFASYSNDILTFTPKLDDYFDFVVKLLVAFGIVFELPLFLFFLARLGIVTYKGLRKKRKYAVLAAFVLAAALTPPDAVSQTMMAVPLVLLYEVGIWLAYFFGKKKPEPEREEAPAA